MSLLNSFTQRILLEKDEEKKKKTEEEITSPEDIEPEELDAAPGGDEEASPDAEDKGPSIVTTDEDNVDVPEPEEDDDTEETPEEDDVDVPEPEGEEETTTDDTGEISEEDDVDVPEPEGDDEPTADDTPTEEPGAGGGEVLQAPGAGNDETGDVDDPPNFEDDNDAGDGGNAASTGDSPEGGNAGGDEANVDIPEPDNDSGAGGGDEEPDSGDAGDTGDEESEGDEGLDAPVGSIQADIKKIEDELFEELSPEQKAIKNKELKQQFVRLYYVIERFKEKVDTINKNSDNIQIISRVGDSLDKLSKLVKYYIIVTYNTKSYFENKSDIYYCLWALDRINKLICTIAPEDSGL